jgi:hypothetical protein
VYERKRMRLEVINGAVLTQVEIHFISAPDVPARLAFRTPAARSSTQDVLHAVFLLEADMGSQRRIPSCPGMTAVP